MLKMKPVFHELFVGGALALRDLVFVVGEYEVYSASVNIKALSEIFESHRRTFNMPAGPPFSPRRMPKNIAVFRLPSFPQYKVRRLLFAVFVQRYASALLNYSIFQAKIG